jgi:diguanylate cyclase (GGDEF)-like protein
MVLYAIALTALRAWGLFLAAGNIAAFAVFITILAAAAITGGYRDSPFTQMFVVVPVLVFLLVGLRSGIVWSALTITALFGLLFADQVLNLHYQLLKKTDVATFRRFLPFVMASMVIFALIVYELMNESLKRQLNRERNRFAFKASHDSLTDLPNRSEFYVRLRHGLEDIQISDSSLALIYIDLDGFKPINDSYGHHAGDKVLKILASRLRGMVRQQDTVARLGGDEFALILTGVKQVSDVESIIIKTLAVITEPIEIDGTFVIVHGSAGIALSPQHSRDSDKLCRLADQAMYKAKEIKNTYRFSETTQTRIEISAA